METAYDGLDQAASNLDVKDILRIGTGDAANRLFGNVKDILVGAAGDELRNLLNGNMIARFLAVGGKDANGIVNMLIDDDIADSLGDKASDKDLVARIRDAIKDELKKDRDNYLKNWKQNLNNTIARIEAGGNKAASGIPKGALSTSGLGSLNYCTVDLNVGVIMGGGGNPVFTHDARFLYEGSGGFSGSTFIGTASKTYADNDKVAGSGSISITVAPTSDPKVYQVTGFRFTSTYSCMDCYVPVKQGTTDFAAGNKQIPAQLNASGNAMSVNVKGTGVRGDIDSFKWTQQYSPYGNGNYDTSKLTSTSVSTIQINFSHR